MMRLLSPPAGKSRREVENAAQELRSAQLDTAIRDKRKEINDIDALMVKTLSETGAKNYEEEQMWKEKIGAMTAEVDQLEARKKRALVPLDSMVKMLQDKESALLKREEAVAIKESEAEYTKQLLEDKLDTLSEREQAATDYSQTLNNREFAIQLQEGQIRERMAGLTVILQGTFDDITKAQEEAARYKAVLKGRDVSIAEREKNVELQQASFADRERAIADRYQTLLRAITETNLKDRGDNKYKGKSD